MQEVNKSSVTEQKIQDVPKISAQEEKYISARVETEPDVQKGDSCGGVAV